jgi:hypothetical protein
VTGYLALSGHVRFGSKADICSAKGYVRFTPDSDRKSDIGLGTHIGSNPLWVISGHSTGAVIETEFMRADANIK